jgi:DNA-binding winged helix-turn-helix (wHTH) protein
MPQNALSLKVVPPPRYIRFGPFELDSRAGELRKHSIKVRLQQQGFQILLMLLKHPGEVVLREEIRQKLWPQDTAVEFDHSINTAIQKLRDALGESAGNPRYIETLPRRGYRFIGTVETPPVEPVDDLAAPSPEAVEPADTPAGQVPSARPWFLPVFAALLTVLVGGLTIAGWLRPSTGRAPVGNWTLSLGTIGNAVVSPDGSAVAYRIPGGLAVRRMDSIDETPVYTLGRLVDSPSWSTDGSQLLFHTLSGLIRLPLPHGPPLVVWPKMSVTRGYNWGLDGTVLAAVHSGKPDGGELYRIPAAGGDPALLEVPGLTHGRFFYPEFLPDGRDFLFAWAADGDVETGLYLATTEKGKITRGPLLLRKNMTSGQYSPSGGGRLLYVQDDKLYAQKLNLRRGALEGEPERVVDGVFSEVPQRRASFSVSRNGVLVWRVGRAGLAQLTWFDRTGKVLGTAGPPCLGDVVRLSGDEKHVLLYTVADRAGFSVAEPNQSGYVKLLGLTTHPLWMPDSSHILYSRKDGTSFRLLERAVAGGAERELMRVPELNQLRDVSADGKVLLYTNDSVLYSVRLDGSPQPANPHMVAQAVQGRFSPDGRWIVYSANTGSNSKEVYVQPYPPGGLRTQLTSTGGDAPIWRGDGKEILYRNGTTIYGLRVEVRGSTLLASPPEALFDVRVPAGLTGDSTPMAVSRDGSRILFAQGVEQPDPQLTYVMTAWDTILHK